ncbi:Phage integrase, N-terminal SAM-like domain [Streptomyces aidingensis]|uniref:Phage integrase, N-terminal SAM-like domain n=1 Tax=Streptomyces aidingensis TaxID=910347 RepID=A0A1I1QDD4_9ACTN|nr:Phage integrase, N-terminal SAM-like domain [Streptomyces aidingensis]
MLRLGLAEYGHWLTHVARAKVRKTSYVNDESLVRNYITPGLGKKKPARLTARDIRAFLVKTARTCQCCAQGKEAKRPSASGAAVRSPSAARSVLRTVRSASCWSSCGRCSSTPSRGRVAAQCGRERGAGHGDQREIEPLAVEEGRRLLDAARSNRLWAVYELAVRKGPAAGGTAGPALAGRGSGGWRPHPPPGPSAGERGTAHRAAQDPAVRAARRRAPGVRHRAAGSACPAARRPEVSGGEVLGHGSIRVTVDIYTFVRLDAQRSPFGRVGDALSERQEEEPPVGLLVRAHVMLRRVIRPQVVRNQHTSHYGVLTMRSAATTVTSAAFHMQLP